jgi:hypothetical protein
VAFGKLLNKFKLTSSNATVAFTFLLIDSIIFDLILSLNKKGKRAKAIRTVNKDIPDHFKTFFNIGLFFWGLLKTANLVPM